MTSQLYLKSVIRPVPSGEAGKKIDGPKNATRNTAEQEAYHNYRTVYAALAGFGKGSWFWLRRSLGVATRAVTIEVGFPLHLLSPQADLREAGPLAVGGLGATGVSLVGFT